MKIINLSETDSILNQYVSEIRNVEVQNDRLRFRRNIERIGEVMAYEMSKTFAYSVKEIQTPLGIAPVRTPDNPLVISTILRFTAYRRENSYHYRSDACHRRKYGTELSGHVDEGTSV